MPEAVSKISKFNKPLLPEQVQLKYRLMNESMYSFYRGTCHLFYESLSKEKKLPFSPSAWICGDLHIENFGTYKGDNRLVYFDLNDFDEAVLAPASWELVRLLTSIFIAFESLKIENKKAINMAALFLKTYSQTLVNGKSFYIEPKTAQGLVCDFLTAVSKRKQKELLSKRTYKKGNRRMLSLTKKHLQLDKTEKKELVAHINEWIINNSGRPYNYEVQDVVFRVAGLGSLGLKRYLFLLKSTNVKEKYLLVDMKQSRSSSLLPFLKVQQPAWNNESERIISVQQRMQNVSPFLLSTTSYKEHTYVLQELQPTKDSINFHLIKNHYRDICQVINDMAVLTASAQLRSASRQNAAGVDELIQFGQNEKWQQELIKMAVRYTALVKKQYVSFHKAYMQNVKLKKKQI
jgi:uncharacterized protein (DUF2252 family)